MGALHSRVVATAGIARLAWIADPSEEIGRPVADRFNVPWMPEPDYSNVDAVVIAAPTEHHFELAGRVLDLGLPLLLEKAVGTRAERFARTDRTSQKWRVCADVRISGAIQPGGPHRIRDRSSPDSSGDRAALTLFATDPVRRHQ